ncbi:TPA: hypothetical protein PEI33_002791 [Staphylococcus aureus]|nr:hypothetical protein [Staphylococcus aureus]
MLYLPKPKLTLREQVKLDTNSYAFKEFAKDQLDRRQKRYFAADFECTTQEPYRVYMVTIEDIYTHEQWFYETIDEFLMFCEMHPNSVFYFHNGENYDLQFIISRVLQDDNKWTFHQSRGYSIKKVLNEFEVSAKGTKFKTKKGTPLRLQANIQFRDTTNIFSTSLEELGDSIGIAKGYGYITTPTVAYIYSDNTWCNQNEDYELIEQTSDFDEFALKSGWWAYAMQDTHILAEVIRYYNVLGYAEENKHTIAKIAYGELLKTDDVYNNYVENLKRSVKDNEDFANEMEYLNKFAKQAYRGGLAWTNSALAKRKDDGMWEMPLFENVLGYHIDYNSMYPAIYMQSDKYPLPTNLPSNKVTDLYIIEYTNLRAKCRSDKFPLIKNRTEDIDGKAMKTLSSRYYMHTVKEKNIVLTSVEDEYMHKYYSDIKFDSFNVIYYDRHYKLEHALRQFGEKWYNEKVESKKVENKARTLYSKMMLNSVYGYLGFFNKIVDTYEYILDETGKLDKRIKDSDSKTGAKSKKAVLGLPHAEVPAAAFITAYGRVKLAEDINKIGINNVVCIDTDSLFVINVEYDKLKELVDIDPYKLGALDCEHEFSKIISLKPKTWCISDDLEQAREYPDKYAKANPYKPIAQATAGSNYQFKDIRSFYTGNKIYVTQKERGIGGVGIVPRPKKLGIIERDTVDDYNQSILDSY